MMVRLIGPSFIRHSFQMIKYNPPLLIGVCVGIIIGLIVIFDCKYENIGSDQDIKTFNQRKLASKNETKLYDIAPQLKFIAKLQNKEKPDEFIRPRYYSSELDMREKVFVAVISSKSLILNYGLNINKTLNEYVDKLIFFIDGYGSEKLKMNIPIVGFKDAKPLVAIFRILSYIIENYRSKYDYFMFVSIDTYVHGRRLKELLRKTSVSQDVYAGIPLEIGSDYCSLDHGIILSHNLLENVGEYLSWCTKKFASYSFDKNFGQCILHATNLPCSPIISSNIKYKSSMLHYPQFYGENRDTEYYNRLLINLPPDSVTISNINDPNLFFILHQYFLIKDLKLIADKKFHLRSEIKNMEDLSALSTSEIWPVGSHPLHFPPTRHDIIAYVSFNATHIFIPDALESIQELSVTDAKDISSTIQSAISHFKITNPHLEYDRFVFGHRMYDSTRGMDYVLSLEFKERETGEIIRKNFDFHRGLTLPEMIPMPYVTEEMSITLVLFIHHTDINDGVNFLDNINEEIADKLSILFVAFEGQSIKNIFEPLKEASSKFTKKFYENQCRASLKLMKNSEVHSDIAIMDLAIKKMSSDTLILFTTPQSSITKKFLARVKINTIKGRQIFSPIPFVMYHPDLVANKESYSKKQTKKLNGHFDKYFFGSLSFYIEDYIKARKASSSIFKIARYEKDLLKLNQNTSGINFYNSFLDLFVKNSTLHTLRAVEPDLIQPFSEDFQCVGDTRIKDSTALIESRNDICLKRKYRSYGTVDELCRVIFNDSDND